MTVATVATVATDPITILHGADDAQYPCSVHATFIPIQNRHYSSSYNLLPLIFSARASRPRKLPPLDHTLQSKATSLPPSTGTKKPTPAQKSHHGPVAHWHLPEALATRAVVAAVWAAIAASRACAVAWRFISRTATRSSMWVQSVMSVYDGAVLLGHGVGDSRCGKQA